MSQDKVFNERALIELTLRLHSRGDDVTEPAGSKLREYISHRIEKFPKPKKLGAARIAADSAVETFYLDYVMLSYAAVHCSLGSLARHVISRPTPEKYELGLSVFPPSDPAAPLSNLFTVLRACRALLATALGVADFISGFTGASTTLVALEDELIAMAARLDR